MEERDNMWISSKRKIKAGQGLSHVSHRKQWPFWQNGKLRSTVPKLFKTTQLIRDKMEDLKMGQPDCRTETLSSVHNCSPLNSSCKQRERNRMSYSKGLNHYHSFQSSPGDVTAHVMTESSYTVPFWVLWCGCSLQGLWRKPWHLHVLGVVWS